MIIHHRKIDCAICWEAIEPSESRGYVEGDVVHVDCLPDEEETPAGLPVGTQPPVFGGLGSPYRPPQVEDEAA